MPEKRELKEEAEEDELRRLARTAKAIEIGKKKKEAWQSPCDAYCTNQFWCCSLGCLKQEAAYKKGHTNQM